MTLYGDFDGQFRRRPTLVRLALFSLSVAILSALFANLLLSAADMLLLRSGGLESVWVVDGTPWRTLAPRVAVHRIDPATMPLADAAMRADRISLQWWPVIPAVAGLLAWFILDILPGPQSLAGLLSVRIAAAVIALVGGVGGVLRPRIMPIGAPSTAGPWPPMVSLAVKIAGGLLCLLVAVRAERKTNELLGNLFAVETPGARLPLWAARVLPAALLIGGAALVAGDRGIAAAAGLLLVETLLVNLGAKARVRHEKILEPEMHEAAAIAPVLTAALVGAIVWAFGFRPLLPDRAVVVKEGWSVSRPEWSTLRRTLPEVWKTPEIPGSAKAAEKAKPEKKLDIHWTHPHKGAKGGKL